MLGEKLGRDRGGVQVWGVETGLDVVEMMKVWMWVGRLHAFGFVLHGLTSGT